VLVDEEGYAVDGGFFGEDFLVIVFVVDDDGLFYNVVFVLVEFSIFAGLFVLVLGVGLGVGLGLKFGGGGRFRSGNRVNRCLGLGLGFLDLYLGFNGSLNLGFNRSLLDDFRLLGILARLLLLDFGFDGSLLDNFSLLGVLARLLDFGFIARCIDEILNDVLVGNIALNGDGLLGPRLANLGLLDGLVLGCDELLHDLGVGRGL